MSTQYGYDALLAQIRAAYAAANAGALGPPSVWKREGASSYTVRPVTAEMLDEQRKRVLAADHEKIRNALSLARSAGMSFAEMANALKVHPTNVVMAMQTMPAPTRAEFAKVTASQDAEIAKIEATIATRVLMDDDVTFVVCPTCGDSVQVRTDTAAGQLHRDWRRFGWSRGSVGHVRGPDSAWCVSAPYREPWWLRALRTLKRWSDR